MTRDSNALCSESAGVPPRLNAATSERRVWWLVAAIAAGAVLVALYFFNPALSSFYPRCFLYSATGILCPGCGGLRATHQLLHGHVLEAFRLNALFVVALPVIGALVLWRTLRRDSSPARVSPWGWIALAAAVLFTVLRNLPVFPWLAP